MDRNSPLREIKGVGAKTEELFDKIGVYTVGDSTRRGTGGGSWTDHKNSGSAEGAHHADHSYDDQ